MGAGPGGIGQLIMSALQSRTAAGGGGAPGMPGGGGDPSGGDPSQQYAQQVSELKGADPGMLLRQMKQMQKICAVLAVNNLERLPNVAGKLSQLSEKFNGVIKELMQAQNVNSAVRQPVGMGAAQPPQDGVPGGM